MEKQRNILSIEEKKFKEVT